MPLYTAVIAVRLDELRIGDAIRRAREVATAINDKHQPSIAEVVFVEQSHLADGR